MSEPQPTQNQENLNALFRITKKMTEASPEEHALVRKAFSFAERVHKNHFRFSGEPYLKHLIETAQTLAELGTGGATVAAGLLHDSIEDIGIKREELIEKFGEEVTFLVEGVTKLGHIKYKGVDKHNESLRKLFVAISEDIRVILIKLADRLHNIRTLSYVPEPKQKRIAAETLEIYAPIAYRLGMGKISRELEDLSFPYVYPEKYEEMRNIYKERRFGQNVTLEKFSQAVKKALVKEGSGKVKIEYRVKGLYSLYKKYIRHEKDLEKIYDISAMRILVETVADCYQTLGVIHGHWRPLPNRIKDYIAFPKPNGYQALHTTVFTGDGGIVEVQIKTHDMHRYAEYGIASHLLYKEGRENKNVLAWVYSLLPKLNKSNGTNGISSKDIPKWISELATYEETDKNHRAFREGLASDFFNQRIFAFSPKGDVVDLPIDSTPVDFAYAIHSDIGDRVAGAKVNGKMVSLDTKLKNGDIVHVMTSKVIKPNRKWLEIAKTSMARRHIRQKLGKMRKDRR